MPTSNNHTFGAGSNQALQEAHRYDSLGFRVIALHRGTKKPKTDRWPNHQTNDEEMRAEFAGEQPSNIGVVLGRVSGGLVDVEGDSPEAVKLLPRYMPATEATFGRRSKPVAHRLYYCDDPPRSMAFKDPIDGRTLAEIRADGHQTMFPPSLHESGERVGWYRSGEPARVSADELVRCARRLAAAALIAKYTGDGNRHDPILAWAAILCKAGMPPEDVERFLQPVIEVTDGDEGDLERAVEDTIRRYEAGEQVAGYSKLADVYGQAEAKKLVSRVLEWLGLDGSDILDERPRINVAEGELGQKTDLAIDALVSVNEPPVLFRHANLTVRIALDDNGRPLISQVNAAWLKDYLSRVARWYRVTRGGRVAVHPPDDVVRSVIELLADRLPVLQRMVAAPVFASDGTLVSEPGYSDSARVYYDPPANLRIAEVPERPSAEEIARAKALFLDELLVDFPLVDEADRAHAVAAILLPFGRDFIHGPTPLHDVEAPTEGTGKGLLEQCLTLPSSGSGGIVRFTEAGNEEEWRKRITAALVDRAPSVAIIDNVHRTLDSAALASVLTSTEWNDRELGHSRIAHASNRCLWLMTANNPSFSAEIARRTVRIRLDARRDRPYLREGFKHVLPSWAEEYRGELIWAALTLWRAWLAADRPAGTKTLGSYESWARVMGGVLQVAGIEGFLDNRDQFYSVADAEGERWRALVAAWWETRQGAAVTARELYSLIAGSDLFRFRARDANGEVKEFGHLLRGQRERIYGGFLIQPGRPARNGAQTYSFVRVGEQAPEHPESQSVAPHEEARKPLI